ncbi:hypothetical protein KUCAC02_030437, partial [Chaenocephalus aceratus]
RPQLPLPLLLPRLVLRGRFNSSTRGARPGDPDGPLSRRDFGMGLDDRPPGDGRSEEVSRHTHLSECEGRWKGGQGTGSSSVGGNEAVLSCRPCSGSPRAGPLDRMVSAEIGSGGRSADSWRPREQSCGVSCFMDEDIMEAREPDSSITQRCYS